MYTLGGWVRGVCVCVGGGGGLSSVANFITVYEASQ